MTNRSNRGLEEPLRAKRFVRVEVIGIQSADFIKAPAMCAPHLKAGHMAAPDRAPFLLFLLQSTGPSTHGSVCLNSFWLFAKWILALGYASARIGVSALK
jgi:hypothetical protein